MGFIRLVLSKRNSESGVEEGLFRIAYLLRDDASVQAEHRQTLRDTLAWFQEHLAVPQRFNRTKSKGHYRRNTRGIAWFRDSATECGARMHKIKEILEAYGHQVTMISETRVGYIVYEDDLKVVAEPFSDTETGPL